MEEGRGVVAVVCVVSDDSVGHFGCSVLDVVCGLARSVGCASATHERSLDLVQAVLDILRHAVALLLDVALGVVAVAVGRRHSGGRERGKREKESTESKVESRKSRKSQERRRRDERLRCERTGNGVCMCCAVCAVCCNDTSWYELSWRPQASHSNCILYESWYLGVAAILHLTYVRHQSSILPATQRDTAVC